MFAQKYRPSCFADFLGADETIRGLETLLASNDRPRTYLFHGQTGCGKTTLARIVANVLGTDPYEVNVGAEGGVDTARELIAKIQYRRLDGKPRVLILDEVQQGTKPFFNALLKPLEEPPTDVYFVLCTTELRRLPLTIRNRCFEYQVLPLERRQSARLVRQIASLESLEFCSGGMQKIIDVSAGIPRIIVQLLEKISTIPPEKQMDVLVYGFEITEEVKALCQVLLKRKPWNVVSSTLSNLKEDPETVRRMVLGWMGTVLLRSGDPQAAIVITLFRQNFFDCEKAGLYQVCYEACLEDP